MAALLPPLGIRRRPLIVCPSDENDKQGEGNLPQFQTEQTAVSFEGADEVRRPRAGELCSPITR